MDKPGIGTLQESSLHNALKKWYARPGDLLETKVGGYWIDIVRGDQLIEIQTKNFSSIRKKLERLVKDHPVRLVYPIAVERWILRIANISEQVLSTRKSPKRGKILDLFSELVRFPHLVIEPNFSLEILYIQEEAVWQDDGRGSWRRKHWSLIDHRLVNVIGSREFHSVEDYYGFLPPDLPQEFTVQDLAGRINTPGWLANKMAYSLRQMGILEVVGKKRQAYLYAIKEHASATPGGTHI